MNLSNRLYAVEADLLAMIDLLHTIRPPERLNNFPTAVDLREVMALDEVRQNTRLWFSPNEQLAAFAFVDIYHNLRFELDRQAANVDLEKEIVDWGLTCIRRTMQETGKNLTLDTSCYDTYLERIALLERNCFLQQSRRTLLMVHPLTDLIPTPILPEGFQVKRGPNENEAASIVILHRTAFGTEFMTVEQRLAMMHTPEYDPQLDFMIIAPKSRIAAYCYCSISQEEEESSGLKTGHFDTGAAHPDFQRQGLAQALLLTGMQEFKERGLEQATLGTSSENIPMQRAAKSVGFRTMSTKLWFTKPVD